MYDDWPEGAILVITSDERCRFGFGFPAMKKRKGSGSGEVEMHQRKMYYDGPYTGRNSRALENLFIADGVKLGGHYTGLAERTDEHRGWDVSAHPEYVARTRRISLPPGLPIIYRQYYSLRHELTFQNRISDLPLGPSKDFVVECPSRRHRQLAFNFVGSATSPERLELNASFANIAADVGNRAVFKLMPSWSEVHTSNDPEMRPGAFAEMLSDSVFTLCPKVSARPFV